MIGGQVRDVLWEKRKRISKKELIEIHHNKTAKMFIAAFGAGAAVAGANKTIIKKMEKIGERIGLAFQIHNDLQDVLWTSEQTGKKSGGDARNNKHTYVTVFGLEAAKTKYAVLVNEAIEMLQQYPNSKPVIDIIKQFAKI